MRRGFGEGIQTGAPGGVVFNKCGTCGARQREPLPPRVRLPLQLLLLGACKNLVLETARHLSDPRTYTGQEGSTPRSLKAGSQMAGHIVSHEHVPR